jgi:hypothetical protein
MLISRDIKSSSLYPEGEEGGASHLAVPERCREGRLVSTDRQQAWRAD